MNKVLALAASVSLFGTGCMVRVPAVGVATQGDAVKKCPPGHTWSDGRCHDKGKGHDPEKRNKHK
jgi:hypothetical protein